MKIILLGTGVAIPQKDRVQSGLIVDAGFDNGYSPVLFDCGCGVLQRIYQSGYRHTHITSVFLSHLHLDHCGDLLALVKANWLCDTIKLNLWGPLGTRQWLDDLLAAYPYMQDKVDIRITELDSGQVVGVEGLEVECVQTVHALPSLGFKVTSGGKTMLYSGDTEPVDDIVTAAEGIDLLIHECSFPDTFEVTNHTTPGTLAEKIEGTSIGRIVLTHLYPQTRGFGAGMVKVLAEACGCPVEIGYDLQIIEV
ncbi:MAG: MBL fold metallo-hydrolase [Methanosarcinales archaeon]|nr:MBL fold metallo-hydrolase [Methanosarcinales archaeon]